MKILNKILLVLFFTLALAAQSNDEILSQANSAYQNKNYQEAVKLYSSIVKNGYAGGELFYNLGNAHFKNNQIGFAILYYEKAIKYNPGDEDIIHNLAIANSRTVDKIQEVPQLFLLEWFNYYLAIFPVTAWSIILYVFYLAFIGSIGFFFLTKKLRLKRTSLFFSALTFILLVLVGITLFAKVNQETTSHYGILISKNIVAKNSPDENSNDAFIINEGIKFELKDTVNNWGKIKLSDGKVGWLPKSSFEKI